MYMEVHLCQYLNEIMKWSFRQTMYNPKLEN